MMNIEHFLHKSTSQQADILTHPSLDKDLFNNIIELYADQMNVDLLISSIELHGFKLNTQNLDILIKLNNKEIMTSLAQNFQIKLSINHMRDLTRLVEDELIKQHPDYKEFWYATYVQKENEFLQHTLHHIKNVNVLADEVIDFILDDNDLRTYFNIPQGIKNKDIKTVIREGMKLHDKAKICTNEEFLKENKLIEPLYKTLYSHYGKGLTPELKEVVKKLNSIDSQIISDYLNDYDEWLSALFFKVEKIADCVERGCNKVTPEEMKQEKTKPSKYLEKMMNPVELKIVKFFEENYSKFCKEIF